MTRKWKVAVVYDSEGLPGFSTGWDFSALLASEDISVLFDTGWGGHILRSNLGRLGIFLSEIQHVFISHGHWDHISGLSSCFSSWGRGRGYLES